MYTELSIEIERPIESVFELALNNVADWSHVVLREEMIENRNDGGVGTRSKIVTSDRDVEMEFDCIVKDHDPPHRTVVEMQGQHFDILATYLFENLGYKTRVTQQSQVTGKGLTKIMFLLFGWLMKGGSCKAQAKELQLMKEYVESNC